MNDVFYTFEPHAKQKEFLLSDAPITAAVSALRSGKSEVGGFHVAGFVRGEHPVLKTPDRARIWTVAQDEGILREVVWPKMMAFIPDELVEEKIEKPGWFYVKLNNGNEVRGKAGSYPPHKFSGSDLDMVHFDELPEEPIWDECRARLIDRQGRLSIVMTAPIPLPPWFYRRVIKSPSSSVKIVKMTMRDNPNLCPEDIDKLEAGLSWDKARVRVHGDYIMGDDT